MNAPILTRILEKDSGHDDSRIWLKKKSVSMRDKPTLAMWDWWETVCASGNKERKGQNEKLITVSYIQTNKKDARGRVAPCAIISGR